MPLRPVLRPVLRPDLRPASPSTSRPDPRPTLLAVAHGTREADGIATTEALVARVRALRPELRVELCFLDLVSPSLPEALARLRGEVVLVPLLLAAGYHVRVDIPTALADAPHLRAHVAHALGPDPLLAEALADRLAEAGPAGTGRGAHSAVVLAAAGSTDPAANADTVAMAALLRERLSGPPSRFSPDRCSPGRPFPEASFPEASPNVCLPNGFSPAAVPDGSPPDGPSLAHVPVVPAYLCAAGPTPAEAVAALRAEGHERIAVASYLLAPGFFARRATQAGACLTSAPLGPHNTLAHLVTLRYDEALADRRRGLPEGRTGARSGRMLTPG
ncbi:sirohydrochlorin chelatase [Streptacidiphilus sp. MAP12-33]|uniref:sirohydrochlorin chelatase n=1 Tax=Streptacidiphilus sp. MAP12-33 TaxID=3156266 RepID=UPI003511008D